MKDCIYLSETVLFVVIQGLDFTSAFNLPSVFLSVEHSSQKTCMIVNSCSACKSR